MTKWLTRDLNEVDTLMKSGEKDAAKEKLKKIDKLAAKMYLN